MNVRISIIIPVYKVEEYLNECVQSAIDQTYRDIEIILVDDGSPDRCPKMCDEWAKRDERIKVIHQANGGLSAARNAGVRVAQGEYLYFLDSDDYLVPDALDRMLTLADKHGGVDLMPALYLRDDHSVDHFTADAFPEFSDDQHLIKRALLNYDRLPVTAANRLIQRELFLEHNLWFKEGIIHEDNYWTFFLAKHVKRMAYLPEKIYYYRITEGSISNVKNVKKESLAFKILITDLCNNIDPFERGAQMELILNTIIVMQKNGYYESEEEKYMLISLFASKNRWCERVLLSIYLKTKNVRILHVLIRLYNI